MLPIEARVSQLVRWNAKKGRVYVRSFAVDVRGKTQERLGNLYGVLAAQAAPQTGDALVAHIEDALVRGSEEALRKLPADAEQEAVLEASLQRVNYALSRLLDENGLPMGPEQVQGVIVSQRGGAIAAGLWGSPTMLLFHGFAKTGMKVVDLAAGAGNDSGRGFTNLISGAIGPQDKLFISTTDLRELLGEEKLKSLVGLGDPDSSVNAIRDHLSPLGDSVAIAMLVVDARPANAAPAPNEKPKAATQASLDNLLGTKSKTAEVLAPPLPELAKRTGSALAAAAMLVPKFFSAAARLLRSLFRKDARRAALHAFADGLTERFNGLSHKSRFLFLAALSLLLALNGSVVLAGIRSGQQEKLATYDRAVAAIDQKIDAADASVIYRDEDRARKLLEEAKLMTAALPDKKKEQVARKEALALKIDAANDALRHVFELGAPEVTASIVTTKETPVLHFISRGKDGLWSVSAGGELFKIGNDGAADKVAELPQGERPLMLDVEGGTVLTVTREGSVRIAGKSGEAGRLPLDAGTEAVDADAFGTRIYLLDPASNRILRFVPTESGYSPPQFYLKDGTDVSGAVSLAIDGSVYVLAKNGAVTMLVKGLRENFSVAAADPPVQSAKKIRTAEDSESLYVLDGSPARILHFSKKTGALLAQYVSEQLADANDFTVDEKQRVILAAVGNRILKFSMPE